MTNLLYWGTMILILSPPVIFTKWVMPGRHIAEQLFMGAIAYAGYACIIALLFCIYEIIFGD